MSFSYDNKFNFNKYGNNTNKQLILILIACIGCYYIKSVCKNWWLLLMEIMIIYACDAKPLCGLTPVESDTAKPVSTKIIIRKISGIK